MTWQYEVLVINIADFTMPTPLLPTAGAHIPALWALGEQGWELVSVMVDPRPEGSWPRLIAFLKRPAPDQD